jgi:hypothetical protein
VLASAAHKLKKARGPKTKLQYCQRKGKREFFTWGCQPGEGGELPVTMACKPSPCSEGQGTRADMALPPVALARPPVLRPGPLPAGDLPAATAPTLSSRVSLLSRKFTEARPPSPLSLGALMQLPRVSSERLMWAPSFTLLPWPCICADGTGQAG